MIQQIRSSDHVTNEMSVTPSSVPDRWLLVVKGMAQVKVEDQLGRRIGPNQEYPNLIENQIPGARYNRGQFFSSVFLNQPGVYTFMLIGQFPDSVKVSLGLYNAMGKFYTFFFHEVLMTERGQAQIVYNTADQSAMPVLTLDQEGNGEVVQIQPIILSPQASNDVEPPTTQIDTNDNIATISAMDNPGGAGILRTYYSMDGMTRATYTEPFPLPSDAKIVMAYSEDRAGNLEYPGAVRPVLGLSENHVVMRTRTGSQEIVKHIVDVVNLDPIPITGQLDWEAWTDVPWLSVEPRAGTTPYSITLSVRPVDLTADLHAAKVVIRSLTTGTVFAERTLDVYIEEEKEIEPNDPKPSDL